MYNFLYNNRIKIREIKERSLQNLTRDYINHHTRSEMVEKEMQKDLSRADMMNLLDSLYSKSIQGIPMISSPIEKMADDYLQHNVAVEDAAKDMINKQVIKCTTSGFITNLGGVITLPVAIPANVGSVMYVQMRMIACAAYMAGYDVHTDQVQTLVYACLAGVSVMEVVKKAGIKIGQKGLENLIDKIPGKVLIAINKKVGFRMLTKFGEKGAINIGKAIPVVGGVIGGGFDFVDTKFIGNRAYNQFIKGDFDYGSD